MKRSMKLLPLLIAAALTMWCTARPEAPPPVVPGGVAALSQSETPQRHIPAGASWRRGSTSIEVEPREREPLAPLREDVDELATAELEAELDAVIGDAESYWELSAEGREQYDALEAARLARLGMPDVSERLAPWVEVLTLDGQPLAQEVTP